MQLGLEKTNVRFSDSGELLISGGDDKRLLLWNLHDLKVVKEFKGHQNNVFNIHFAFSDHYLYSCGLDGLILKYNTERGGAKNNQPCDVLHDHESSVMKISVSPCNPNILLSASLDGTVRLWDLRAQEACKGILVRADEQKAVTFQKSTDSLFLIGGEHGNIELFDLRTAFRSFPTVELARPLRRFNTVIKRSSKTKPSISHLDFDETGSVFVATLQSFLPTIYAIDSIHPICVMHGSEYKNVCTMKNIEFGMNGNYVLSGSDNELIYVWKLSKRIEYYKQTRNLISISQQEFVDRFHGIRFEGDVPFEINSQPIHKISGPRSNVNSVIAHPKLPLIASAGVEKVIRLHSSYPIENSNLKANVIKRRHSVGTRIMLPFDDDETEEEDPRTLAMFDVLNAQEIDACDEI